MIDIEYKFRCDYLGCNRELKISGDSKTEARANWRSGGGVITFKGKTYCCVGCHDKATGKWKS